ncbi:hypothetical protein [Paenibacillus xylanexedens]|uniref:hypothetical protein n=1 Tax=Paenibacillus xylanexedens TaxID=528191 RepID=UPI0011A60C5D|nr:hypothetical protein [Paenibacillus xylanexedens]
MDANLINALFAFAGVAVTALGSWIVSKSNNKKDLTVTDRQQLSQDQKELREELRYEIRQLRDEMTTWKTRSMHLEDELRGWKEKYTALELDYLRATVRIEELEKRLNSRDEGGTE